MGCADDPKVVNVLVRNRWCSESRASNHSSSSDESNQDHNEFPNEPRSKVADLQLRAPPRKSPM